MTGFVRYSPIFGRSLNTGTLINAVQDCHKNLAGIEEQIRELQAEAQVLTLTRPVCESPVSESSRTLQYSPSSRVEWDLGELLAVLE